MPTDFFDTQLAAYLSLRAALGFHLRAEQLLLPECVAFLHVQGITGPIRAQLALEWACQASARRGPGGAARRLSIARGFLAYLRASAPETEGPDPSLLPSPRRPKPSLFTPTQLTALCTAAHASRPRRSLRPHTLSTLIGLLASTGLRGGEALRLQRGDVKLALDPPQLHLHETKCYKSRLVPRHPSTAEHLRHYAERRARWHYEALSDAFFVSEQGHPLHHHARHYWFTRRCRRLAIAPTNGGRGPCLMSFRPTFAVTCMRRWDEQGQDIQALLPHLSVSLGHIRPQDSYWYLTAVPELLNAAAQRFQTYAMGGRGHDA